MLLDMMTIEITWQGYVAIILQQILFFYYKKLVFLYYIIEKRIKLLV